MTGSAAVPAPPALGPTKARRRRARAEPFSSPIEDLDHDGRGVARNDGKVTFVHGALPGEQITARVYRRKPKYDEAQLLEVETASAERVQPRCAHFGVCGGCALQHLKRAAQLRHKQAGLLENLERIGAVRPESVMIPIAAEPYGYRRRARLGVKYVAAKGGVLVGFRERRAPYIAVLEGCDVLAPEFARRIVDLREALSAMDARARIPQLEIAVGESAAAMIVRHLDPLTPADIAALERFGRTHAIQIHLQPGGPETVTALEPVNAALLSYRLPAHDIRLEFGPTDFVQVNAAVNEQLVDRVLDGLALSTGSERVLDLFCGLGNFTLPIARRVHTVHGVEGARALVTRARANAKLNKLTNASFSVADLNYAEPVASLFTPAGSVVAFDRVLLDPPRAGAAAMCEGLALVQARHTDAALPRRIVYVSCHPATLARDAGSLVNELGYTLVEAGVADMFPHTAHVESMAVFERR
ncbi:MAG: 23S rRNA (uracil(1939)-C(5))-methyltransferase RlmD [Gammaproteobacteria bacterium]